MYILLWLTLACFSRIKLVQKQIDWTRIDSFSQNDRNGRGFDPRWAWLQKFRARFARNRIIGTPLQDILDPLSQARMTPRLE